MNYSSWLDALNEESVKGICSAWETKGTKKAVCRQTSCPLPLPLPAKTPVCRTTSAESGLVLE